MTEDEWNHCTDLATMLGYLRDNGKASGLFAVACCGRVLHLFIDGRCHHAVEVAERYADGLATAPELAAASRAASAARRAAEAASNAAQMESHIDDDALDEPYWAAQLADATAKAAYAVAYERAETAAEGAAYGSAYAAAFEQAVFTPDAAERVAQPDLLRDLLGPLPFHLIAIDESWLRWNDDCVVKIAAAIYEGRSFDRLPILADALEESGCSHAELLGHLRGPGPHVKGCWAIDLLLGKT